MSNPRLLTERLVLLTELAKALPSRPHVYTVTRWCDRGVGGKKLEFVKIGRKRFTSWEAFARFVEQTSRSESSLTSNASAQLAETVCKAAGI